MTKFTVTVEEYRQEWEAESEAEAVEMAKQDLRQRLDDDRLSFVVGDPQEDAE